MDGLDLYTAQTSRYAINPVLLKIAALYVGEPTEKTAIVPPGGMGAPPGDPSGGMAPPPGGDPSGGMGGPPPADPAAGGAPPQVDPNLVNTVVQAVMQQIGAGGAGAGGGGAAGGAMGKGGKKAEQAITDAKLYAIDMKLSLICQQMNIQLPATATLGAPPDPASAQTASQEHQNASAVASNPDSSAVPGPAPVAPMDPSQGPIGKMAAFGDTWPLSDSSVFDDEPVESSLGARFRTMMGGG